MALADFEPASHTIKLRGGALTVRGINLTDLSRLVSTHRADLELAFGMWSSVNAGSSSMDDAVLALARDFPPLAANIIALACGEADQAEKARAFPFPLQVEALLQIGRMTFEDVGGLEPFLRTLTSLVGGLSPLRIAAVSDEVKAA